MFKYAVLLDVDYANRDSDILIIECTRPINNIYELIEVLCSLDIYFGVVTYKEFNGYPLYF